MTSYRDRIHISRRRFSDTILLLHIPSTSGHHPPLVLGLLTPVCNCIARTVFPAGIPTEQLWPRSGVLQK